MTTYVIPIHSALEMRSEPRKFDWDEDTEAFQSMVDDLRDGSSVEMSRRQAVKVLKLVAKLLDENGLVVVWKDSNGNHTK